MSRCGRVVLVLTTWFLVGGFAAVGGGESRGLDCPDCNVILISIDTLRADHLGCYGYDLPTSPNIDAFRAESVLFDTVVAHAPSTTPSHASIFTSLIPLHHGAHRSRHQPIATGVRTMAEILSGAGYRTVSYNGGGQVAAMWGFDRGFEVYESASATFLEQVQKAARWLDRHPDERFFLFLHTYEVHAPYRPDPKFMAQFDADYGGDLDDEISPRLLIEINHGTRSLDEADARHIIHAYDGGIRSMDAGFGALIAYLERRDLLARSIVIFTSDHGEELGEHGQMGRHSHALYDEVLRVPLIIRLPQAKRAGTVVERQVRGIDVLPTVLDLLDLEPPGQCSGSSLVPLMRGRRGPARPAVSQIDSRQDPPPSSIRTESAKLILGSRPFADGTGHRSYERRAELDGPLHDLELPIESLDRSRRLRISIDGEPVREVVIRPRKHLLNLPPVPAGSTLTLECLTPCTRTAGTAPEPDRPCASFRVFDPYEFFRIDEDPGELQNLFGTAKRRQGVERMRRKLEAILAEREPPEPDRVDVDRGTRDRLKALGYVD